jgi:hypothetical protein
VSLVFWLKSDNRVVFVFVALFIKASRPSTLLRITVEHALPFLGGLVGSIDPLRHPHEYLFRGWFDWMSLKVLNTSPRDMVLLSKSWGLLFILELLESLIDLVTGTNLFLFSPLIKLGLFLLLLVFNGSLNISILSLLKSLGDLFLFFLNCCHLLTESNDFL